MMMDTLKSWLSNIFAWWPWRRSARVTYPQSADASRTSSAQEPLWHTMGELHAAHDPIYPQQGSFSIAVEQGMEELPTHSSSTSMPDLPSTDAHADTNPHAPPAKAEAHLTFLRYLVRRGIVNEGFDYDHVPEQYRRPQ